MRFREVSISRLEFLRSNGCPTVSLPEWMIGHFHSSVPLREASVSRLEFRRDNGDILIAPAGGVSPFSRDETPSNAQDRKSRRAGNTGSPEGPNTAPARDPSRGPLWHVTFIGRPRSRAWSFELARERASSSCHAHPLFHRWTTPHGLKDGFPAGPEHGPRARPVSGAPLAFYIHRKGPLSSTVF